MTTSSRTLRLLSLLQTHRYWSGIDLAGRLEVSVRTLRRDVDRLRDLGYPVEADRGVGGGYQLAPGAALPPLVLDDEEAVALAIGLQASAHGSIDGVAEASVRALAKVIQVMPKRLRRQVDALRTATVSPEFTWEVPATDPTTLVVLAQACRDAELLTFGYRTASGEYAERRVEPVQLVTIGRRWYLLAYDRMRHDWRSFRLDRMERPAVTGARFRARDVPGGDAAAYVQQGLRRQHHDVVVNAEVAAPASDVRERIGRWAQVSEIGAESCRVHVEASSMEWIMIALGLAHAPIISVDNPKAREAMAQWGARFTALSEAYTSPAHKGSN